MVDQVSSSTYDPVVGSGTLPNVEQEQETSPTSGPNPLSGQGVEFTTTEDWTNLLTQNFGQVGGKPVLPNPLDPSILQSYSQVSKETLEHIQRLKDSGVWDGYADLSKLDGDGLALLCMLFTQQSKAEIIRGLKNALATKVQERAEKQADYLEEQKKVLDEQIEMQKAYEEQKAAAEKAAKFKSIFGIIASVVSAVVAVAVTAATFGAASPLAAGLMVAATTLTIAASATSIASAGCTLAVLDKPELAEKLGEHIKNLGIATMVLGIAACVCSLGAGFAGAGGAVEGVTKAIKIGGQLTGALCMIATGVTDIIQGQGLLDLAEKQKALDEKKMELTKLDSDIEFLQKLIDALMKSVEEFLDLFLNTEQAAAAELVRMSDSQLAVADEIPRTA
jgi:hypothetical protein